MYLKALEVIGFKSFANKTKLHFEPGMTCIVGPNGCGKSNVSDAIRWVLGEQSAKALRGGKMEDVIFNGTETQKALGMAEASVTFANCEGTLKTEYHEVTITRRVFRSGEGQYFINKTPCRLKDVQRLFMDTGIGTTSYSFMEQGRIDRVLSSRPEDRRTIFEEASGITKFKSDKKEAIRKLEQTEANLLRLSDVIREVKRQIGSLQRQAGKARRYKSLKDELRKLDIFATRERLRTSDSNIHDLESKMSKMNGEILAASRELEELEHKNAEMRDRLLHIEQEIGEKREHRVEAQNRLDHTHELIKVSRQRIDEYKGYSDRDTRQVEEINSKLAESREALSESTTAIQEAKTEKASAGEKLKVCNDTFEKHKQQLDSTRENIQKLRDESIQLESTTSRLRNHLIEIESKERSTMLQRERLSAEKAQLNRVSSDFDGRKTETDKHLKKMLEEVSKYESALAELETQKSETAKRISELQHICSGLQSEIAATKAQLEIIAESNEANDDLPAGARLLLDETNPAGIDTGKILGSLASHLDVEQEYETALEASLRPWLDAIVISDSASAIDILKKLESEMKGSARLLSLEEVPFPASGANEKPEALLVNHVKCSDTASPVIKRLIGNVIVVESLDAVPSPVPQNSVYVTRSGALIRGDGLAEFWMPDANTSNPLSRKHNAAETLEKQKRLTSNIEEQKKLLDEMNRQAVRLDASIVDARKILDNSRRTAAQKEGELQMVVREAEEARKRMDTVSFELENLACQGQSGDEEKKKLAREIDDTTKQRERISADIDSQTRELRKLEDRNYELQKDVSDHHVLFSSATQKLETRQAQLNSITLRIKELEQALEGRSAGIDSYTNRIKDLAGQVKNAESQLSALQEAVNANALETETLHKARTEQIEILKETEALLASKRDGLELLREKKSELDIRCTETKMRYQNQIERITSEYSVTLEQVMEEPDPEWENQPLSLETIETNVAELRTKLEAMGPVNLVAIEEYNELEERYAFLVEQEQDLINSKQQLMDMIRKINRTTSEMFRTTFEQINQNFLEMYKKLFDGGSAKLVLVNEEDVLDCGIEIIARPPGKKLQNVSLLSGGERTLTAVALLFAIYMIKPSPFCLLDELDAALDDSNIGRFAKVLQDFLAQSQFLIITHNQHTISAASVIYGVTMPTRGISEIVSMKFRNGKTEPAPELDLNTAKK